MMDFRFLLVMEDSYYFVLIVRPAALFGFPIYSPSLYPIGVFCEE